MYIIFYKSKRDGHGWNMHLNGKQVGFVVFCAG